MESRKIFRITFEGLGGDLLSVEIFFENNKVFDARTAKEISWQDLARCDKTRMKFLRKELETLEKKFELSKKIQQERGENGMFLALNRIISLKTLELEGLNQISLLSGEEYISMRKKICENVVNSFNRSLAKEAKQPKEYSK